MWIRKYGKSNSTKRKLCMKTKQLLLILLTLAIGVLVSACTGGTGQATSWPGLSLGPESKVAYLAMGTQVYTINLETGSEIYNARFPKEPDNKVTFFSAPALTEGNQLIVGSYDYNLYSVDPETGYPNQANWPFADSENRYIGGPLVYGEMIYAPSSDNNLYALDTNGNIKWSFLTDDALWGTPVTDGDVVYVPGMDHRVYALDARSGREIWKTESLGGSVAGSPTLGPDGQLFIGTFGNELLGLDKDNGKIIGNMRFTTNNWVWAGPAMDEDRLYFGDLSGTLYALEFDANSFRELWRFPRSLEADTGQPETIAITGKPVVVGDAVYFGTESGFVFKLDKETGEHIWSREVNGKAQTDLKSVDDMILVATMGKDELLYAFGTDGSQLWPAFVPRDD